MFTKIKKYFNKKARYTKGYKAMRTIIKEEGYIEALTLYLAAIKSSSFDSYSKGLVDSFPNYYGEE